MLSFGERNRKTALSRALALATATPAAPAAGAALLQEHGLCEEAAPPGAERDTWAGVGVRLCATLRLRAGQPEPALPRVENSQLPV